MDRRHPRFHSGEREDLFLVELSSAGLGSLGSRPPPGSCLAQSGARGRAQIPDHREENARLAKSLGSRACYCGDRYLRLALLRHGPTLWNVQGRIQGHTDIPLSDEGLEKMRGLRPPSPFEKARAFVSPSRRARQTAEALGLSDASWDPRLMEQNWGRWEGLSRAGILASDGEDAFERAGKGLAFRPPGGESTAELHARVTSFLTDVAQRDDD